MGDKRSASSQPEKGRKNRLELFKEKLNSATDWKYTISDDEFAACEGVKRPVLLALKRGKVIYQDAGGEIKATNEQDDLMITPDAVIAPWNYKKDAKGGDISPSIGHQSRGGTGLRWENVKTLLDTYKGKGITDIIISTGMKDALGVESDIFNLCEDAINGFHFKGGNLVPSDSDIELHIVKSDKVPALYNKLCQGKGKKVGALLHTTC